MNLAARLWEAHQENVDGCEDEHVPNPAQDHDRDAGIFSDKEHDPEDDQSFMYDIAERFLFETDAIMALQTSVKAFVEFQGPCK